MTTPTSGPECDEHGKMDHGYTTREWFCVECGRSISDEDIKRLGDDPSKIVVT